MAKLKAADLTNGSRRLVLIGSGTFLALSGRSESRIGAFGSFFVTGALRGTETRIACVTNDRNATRVEQKKKKKKRQGKKKKKRRHKKREKRLVARWHSVYSEQVDLCRPVPSQSTFREKNCPSPDYHFRCGRGRLRHTPSKSQRSPDLFVLG